MAKPSLLDTAYHEAGHAAVHIYFGLPITVATIKKSNGVLGYVQHPSPSGLENCETSSERRSVARKYIIALYAGLQAERLFNPNASEAGAVYDEGQAFELSREYEVLPRYSTFVGDDLHLDYLESLREDARRLVKRLRPAIDRLARALNERKTLTHDEAVATFKGEE